MYATHKHEWPYVILRGLLKNNVDFCSQMHPGTRIA